MRMRQILLVSSLVMGLGNVAGAQQVRPSELPPSGFDGRMFVDSAGCIFIRSGTPSQVSWVPRVTRNFEQVCGYVPTFAPGQTLPAPSPAPSVSFSTKAQQAAVTQPKAMPVPKGYKAAWDDGRLNTQRGPRTQAGDAAMQLVWSDSVPMKRITASN